MVDGPIFASGISVPSSSHLQKRSNRIHMQKIGNNGVVKSLNRGQRELNTSNEVESNSYMQRLSLNDYKEKV